MTERWGRHSRQPHFTEKEAGSRTWYNLHKDNALQWWTHNSNPGIQTHQDGSWFLCFSDLMNSQSSLFSCSQITLIGLSQTVQSLSHIQLFVTPWTAAYQASLSITNSQSLLKLMSLESVMPSNHLILCPSYPLLLLPSIFPSIRVFSNEPALHIRWPKYWSFSFRISPSDEYSELISFRVD